MKYFHKSVKTVGIIAGIIFVTICLRCVATRMSILYLMFFAILLLSALLWKGWGLKFWFAGFVLIGLFLSLSPVDFVIMRGKPGLQVKPISYGEDGCISGTICYGCIVHNPPEKAIVLYVGFRKETESGGEFIGF